MTADNLYAEGQCLLCGGRGGWWSRDERTPCGRCAGTGWDPQRHQSYFPRLRDSAPARRNRRFDA